MRFSSRWSLRSACFGRGQDTLRITFLIIAILLVLMGCREDEEEQLELVQETPTTIPPVVVTRVVRQTVQVPVTVPVQNVTDQVVLDIGLIGDYETLDPQIVVEDSAIDVIQNIFAGLTRFNHSTNTIDPLLATDWEISDDGLTWTFDLRDDIFWVHVVEEGGGLLSRGKRNVEALRPVVAEDVVYAIHRACDPSVSTPDVFTLFIIAGCEQVNHMTGPTTDDLLAIGARAVDDQTLMITLTEPAGYFLTMTSQSLLRPVPVEYVQTRSETWTNPENIVTSGPFLLSSSTLMGSRTVLDKNPYWPIPFDGNVDLVNIIHLDDNNDAFELWQDLDLDISPIPGDNQDEILGTYGSKADLIASQAVFYLAYNFDSPAFSIPEVRQAFGWAIDREQLIREVYNGRAQAMRHFAPPGVIGAPPFDEVGTGYSPDQARQAIDGTIFGDCRLMPEVRYLVSSSDTALQQAELLRELWVRELGGNEEQIIIEQVQFGTLLALTREDAGKKRPDLWDLGWASYYPDAHNWLNDVLHCSLSENRFKRPCGPVDDLIVAAGASLTIQERWDLYREIERALFGPEAIEPLSPLFVRAEYELHQAWVSRIPIHFGGQQFDSYVVDATVKDLEQNR